MNTNTMYGMEQAEAAQVDGVAARFAMRTATPCVLCHEQQTDHIPAGMPGMELCAGCADTGMGRDLIRVRDQWVTAEARENAERENRAIWNGAGCAVLTGFLGGVGQGFIPDRAWSGLAVAAAVGLTVFAFWAAYYLTLWRAK